MTRIQDAASSGNLVPMTLLPSDADRGLRITTDQRENAVALVREAAADGRLDFDELDQRVGTALRALTREDLASVLSDLVPAANLGAALSLETSRAVPMNAGPGYRWEEPLMIMGTWRRRTIRRGVWEVPPFMEINADTAASVRLDMTHATSRAAVIDLVVTSAGGSITLVVPEGWGVDIQGVQSDGMGASVTSRVPTRPGRGVPRIVVRGRTTGSLSVRHPKRRELILRE